eukprot:1128057-Prymnesium_polylepis.1
MADDFQYDLLQRGFHSDAHDLALLRASVLFDLEERLLSQGEAGAKQRQKLPQLSDAERARVQQITADAQLPREIRDELMYDRTQLTSEYAKRYANVQKLPSQKALVDRVISAVDAESPLCAFVDAPGGTGK